MSPAYRLALADAVQLHNERVHHAVSEVRAAMADVEKAEAHLRLMVHARSDFLRAVKAHEQHGSHDDG